VQGGTWGTFLQTRFAPLRARRFKDSNLDLSLKDSRPDRSELNSFGPEWPGAETGRNPLRATIQDEPEKKQEGEND